LQDHFPDVPATSPSLGIADPLMPDQRTEGLLHQLNLSAIYNHPRGFFARGEALWNAQSNEGYTPAEPGDDFWQFNMLAGYRCPRRNAEITIGLLNLTDQDYKLNPLNLHSELPHSRTLSLRLLLSF
jgi:outer membrane receptor for monomeric catechols